ncbi:MAG: T9SS type A sorting domain-containing protein [Bacteroidetes bacterium]|nr:T9SS type A sorting domain-containing protein [Bacteroidota bacterium]
MKNYTSLLFLCFLAFTISAQSPIILSVDDIADQGQEFLVTNANPVIGFDGSDTGPDHTWDFSDLTALAADTSKWVDVYDTDPFYFFLWLASDVAEQTGVDVANDFITIEDVFNFYERDDDIFGQTGFAGIIAGIPFPIGYDETETIFEFPATYNDNTNSETGFDIDIPGIATWTEQRSRTNEIDGWGSITIPGGTFDVLRMRSEILITDNIVYADVPYEITYTTIEYRWMAKENGIPILQINAQEILGVETTTQVIYKSGDAVDIITDQPSNNFNLFIAENPVMDELNFSINFPQVAAENLQIIISDITGRIMENKSLLCNEGENNFIENIDQLSPGIYFLSLYQSGNILKNIKFIKQ